jgi:GNAT superfamily N-acetyltransferase
MTRAQARQGGRSTHEGLAELRLEQLRGAQIASQLDALAALRIAVFREWPYLYEGTPDYEKQYLETYLRSPRSLAVLAWDGAQCIGASTVLPLADAEPSAQAPFRAAGHDIDAIDYFGESVILRPWRGLGLGVKFFELREAHARELGLRVAAFCAVQRPAQHPARPPDYVPNDAFWQRRGYRPAPELRTQFSWPDIGESQSSDKAMAFWLRELPTAP